MITIYAERCNGCGACLEVCPHGALFLIEGKAVVDEALCRECETCVSACPTEAIVVEQRITAEPSRVPVIQTEPEVMTAQSPPSQVPLRVRALPVVGAALSWVGRELVPRLAYYLLDELDRRAAKQQPSRLARGGGTSSGRAGRGRQRHRHRGGRDSPG